MGFLDNSGDIILDAVLTDLGRERLARGDGSFKITKFAVADDEIDYGKYNKNNPSGSAYYDLDILTTPVLEAFTNNIGSCKHKLMTIPRNNLLYLPVIKLVDNSNIVMGSSVFGTLGTAQSAFRDLSSGMYLVTVDQNTSTTTDGSSIQLLNKAGVITGDGNSNYQNKTFIVLDQGLDTGKIPNTFQLDSDLIENQFIIEMDDRLGKLATGPLTFNASTTQTVVQPNFVDDDRIASYYISKNNNGAFFDSNFGPATQGSTEVGNDSAILGPRGNRISFTVMASLELNTSESLFDRLGSTTALDGAAASVSDFAGTFKVIDSTVRVTGVTTGYRIDIPIRFVKKTSDSTPA
jgi:hypothetical protein